MDVNFVEDEVDIIKKLLKQCNLGVLIQVPLKISGGRLNRMYKVVTTNGIFAIKLLNPEVMKRKNAKNNHIFAETFSHLAKNSGVRSLPAMIIDNNVLQKFENYYFLIFDWFEGRALKNDELSCEKCKKIALEVSKLHKIDYSSLKVKCDRYYDTDEINWNLYLDKIENGYIKNLLAENIQKFIDLDKKSIYNLKKISNNMVISHRDFDLSNILWNENDEFVIIDWESTGLINPSMEVIDLAWNWSGWQKSFDNIKFFTIINTYRDNGGDLSDFDEALIAILKPKFTWLEYNLKRITGIECVDEEDRVLGEKEIEKNIDEINKFILYCMDFSKSH